MSGCLNCLLAGKGSVVVNGSLSGSGSLSIPAGVTSVSLTGAGGTGTQTYNPGQPYIAPFPVYSTTLTWITHDNGTVVSYTSSPLYPVTTDWVQPAYSPSYFDELASVYTSPYNNSYSLYQNMYVNWYAGYAYLYTDPGQPYIAPYYTYYYGPSTTATLNAVTDTWTGGYGVVQGPTSTQNLASNGLGQTLTYSIGTGGFLNYSYTI